MNLFFSSLLLGQELPSFQWKEGTAQLLFGTSELPASLLLHFAAIPSCSQGDLDTSTRYRSRQSDHWHGANRWETVDKAMIPISGRNGKMAWGFIMLFRRGHNLKFLNSFFWNFSFNILGLPLIACDWNHRQRNLREEGAAEPGAMWCFVCVGLACTSG